MKRDDRPYLEHIAEAIALIEEWTGYDRSRFIEDRLTRDAALRNLHTLTESAGRLADNLTSRYPEVAWKDIIGFRNVVVHDYLGLKYEKVWSIIVERLPTLKQQIARILSELP